MMYYNYIYIRIPYKKARNPTPVFSMIIRFMKRKLRKMNSTFMVTVPRVWVDSLGIDVGDQLEISTNERGWLILRPAGAGD